MKTTPHKHSPAKKHRSTAAKQRIKAVRNARRRTYPLHKRMMLHPLGIFIMLCAGVFMTGWTYHALAATTISSTIEAPPLHEAATISTPHATASLSSAPTEVSGTCPSQSYVTLSVNDTFNGAAWCGNNTYSINTSLFPGTNDLAVQAYNATNLPGPSADGVRVTYTPPASAASTASQRSSSSGSSGSTTPVATSVAKPMLLTSDFQFHTFTTQQAFSWNLDLEGGSPPYDVDVSWGDGSNSHFRFPGDPVFTIRHTFATDGYYAVAVKSVDTTGSQHIMQLAALITKKDGTANFLGTGSGQSSAGTGSTTLGNGLGGPAASNGSNRPVLGMHSAATVHLLLVAWPFYIVVVLMTISFWLGEKRELALVFTQPRRRPRHA